MPLRIENTWLTCLPAWPLSAENPSVVLPELCLRCGVGGGRIRVKHMISFTALSATVVTFKKIYLVCECVCVGGCTLWHVCKGQKTVCGSHLWSSLIWNLGIDLSSQAWWPVAFSHWAIWSMRITLKGIWLPRIYSGGNCAVIYLVTGWLWERKKHWCIGTLES